MAAGDVYTSIGESLVIDLMDAATWYVQSGTGTTTPAKGDTALETVAGPSPDETTDTQPSADTLQMVGQLDYTGTLAITEAGIFDGATGSGTDDMLQHHVFAVINVGNGDSIEFTVSHQQA